MPILSEPGLVHGHVACLGIISEKMGGQPRQLPPKVPQEPRRAVRAGRWAGGNGGSWTQALAAFGPGIGCPEAEPEKRRDPF